MVFEIVKNKFTQSVVRHKKMSHSSTNCYIRAKSSLLDGTIGKYIVRNSGEEKKSRRSYTFLQLVISQFSITKFYSLTSFVRNALVTILTSWSVNSFDPNSSSEEAPCWAISFSCSALGYGGPLFDSCSTIYNVFENLVAVRENQRQGRERAK